jgi:cell division protein FtsQ
MSAVLKSLTLELKDLLGSLGTLGRRNRFKSRTQPKSRPQVLPRLLAAGRAHARLFALATLALAACLAVLLVLDRPVATIAMDGAFQRVSPGEIEKAVRPFMHGGLLSADLDAIQGAVEALPWVDRARVQRLWPNSLRVTVTEQSPAARWGDAGLINTRGELFVREATHVPAELPRLSGPEGSVKEVAQRYLAIQARMLEANLRVAALRLDERGAWEVDLDSGITVRLGRRDVDERIDRFIRTAAPVIAHHAGEIAYVDMRYSNGFAIGWRSASAPTPAGAVPLPHAEDSDA